MSHKMNELAYCLKTPFEELEKWGERRGAEHERHIYIDRGSSVLGVCHTDSVQKYNGAFRDKEDRLWCSTVDDRIGLWLLLFYLPKRGVNCDVLLTDYEEMGGSTAGAFKSDKVYNWSFSFDRTGTDVVMYQHDCKEYRDKVKEYGLHPGWGTYSCISDLECGGAGFNFGNGMYQYHSMNAYVKLKELYANVNKFLKFYEGEKDNHCLPLARKVYQYERFEHFEYETWWKNRTTSTNNWNGSATFESPNHWTRNGSEEMVGYWGTGNNYVSMTYAEWCSKRNTDATRLLTGDTLELCDTCNRKGSDVRYRETWEADMCEDCYNEMEERYMGVKVMAR